MKPIVRLIILFVFALAILSITQKKKNQTHLASNSSKRVHHGDTMMQRGEKRRQKAARLKYDIDHSLDQLIKSGTNKFVKN